MRMNVAIGLVDGMEDELVADEPFVDEDVDAAAVGALDFGARRESTDRESGFFFFGVERRLGDGGAEGGGGRRNFDEFIERLTAEKLVDAVGEFFRGRTIDNGLR